MTGSTRRFLTAARIIAWSHRPELVVGVAKSIQRRFPRMSEYRLRGPRITTLRICFSPVMLSETVELSPTPGVRMSITPSRLVATKDKNQVVGEVGAKN